MEVLLALVGEVVEHDPLVGLRLDVEERGIKVPARLGNGLLEAGGQPLVVAVGKVEPNFGSSQ